MRSRKTMILSASLALCLLFGWGASPSYAQQASAEKAAPINDGYAKHGLLANAAGKPVYGFANISVAKWLGLQVFTANFVQFHSTGKYTFGNVAIVASSQPGVYVWVTDVGISGVGRATPSGVHWEDALHNSGKYIPL